MGTPVTMLYAQAHIHIHTIRVMCYNIVNHFQFIDVLKCVFHIFDYIPYYIHILLYNYIHILLYFIFCCVLSRYNNKTYRIDDIDWDKNPLSTFSTRNGEVSFVQYYENAYNKKITDMEQPLLVSMPKKRVSLCQCVCVRVQHLDPSFSPFAHRTSVVVWMGLFS